MQSSPPWTPTIQGKGLLKKYVFLADMLVWKGGGVVDSDPTIQDKRRLKKHVFFAEIPRVGVASFCQLKHEINLNFDSFCIFSATETFDKIKIKINLLVFVEIFVGKYFHRQTILVINKYFTNAKK